ncbi:MAG TPA: hypothetical protein VF121_04115 [Thermoanaerobaculia bacterium]|nr:hypothetical protein [Thermoanaerobaculia bacterium]
MNPLSSFSFGKIIKTFIPGLIAAGAALLLLELVYRSALGQTCSPGTGLWRCFFEESFIWTVALSDGARTAAFGAALVPLALTLGFLLNTLLWLFVNESCRRWCNNRVHATLMAARKELERRAAESLRRYHDGPVPPRVRLADFYLSRMDLEKFTYLNESYFSWFEFQLNSAAALLLTLLSYLLTFIWLANAWFVQVDWLLHLGLPLVLVAGCIAFLVVAGVRNLLRYQEGFIWFLIGTLEAAPATAGVQPLPAPPLPAAP